MSRTSRGRQVRDARTVGTGSTTTSSTTGGTRGISDRTDSIANAGDYDAISPLPPTAKTGQFDWIHYGKIVGAVLGGVIATLTIVSTAVVLLKDVSSIDKKIDDVNSKVEGVVTRSAEIDVKVEGIQSSVHELQRDVRYGDERQQNSEQKLNR